MLHNMLIRLMLIIKGSCSLDFTMMWPGDRNKKFTMMALHAYNFIGYFICLHKYCLLLKSCTITLLMYIRTYNKMINIINLCSHLWIANAHTQYSDDKIMIKYHAWPTNVHKIASYIICCWYFNACMQPLEEASCTHLYPYYYNYIASYS